VAPPLDVGSTRVRIGAQNVAPLLTFIQPSAGAQEAEGIETDGRLEFQFDVEFVFSDTDNEATVDFFYDENSFGVDGKPIPYIQGQETANIVDNDGETDMAFTFQFPPELANDQNAEVFIYGVVTDDINAPRAVYSAGSIVIGATERALFNTQDYIIADNIGQIFGTGNAPVNIPDYRQTENVIRDIELTPASRGALFLNGYGNVVLKGDPDPWGEFVRTSNSVTFPEGGAINLGMDLARDVVADFDRDGYYLLDAMGGVHAVGAVPPAAFQLVGAPSYSSDLARDMEITPTGLGLFILSGNGPTTSMGDARRIENQMDFKWDIARDITLTRQGNGYYLLDGYGVVHSIGGAPALDTTVPLFLGSDVYRSVELAPGTTGVLVMDRGGQVYAANDPARESILLGPNVIEQGAVPPPPGFREGESIDFRSVTPATNVVLGEAPGAFIDLEPVGVGALASSILEIFTGNDDQCCATTTLCRTVQLEDLSGMLTFFRTEDLTSRAVGGEIITRPGFQDDQGHTLDEYAATWKAFFDYFEVLACRIPAASFTVEIDNQQRYDQGDVLIASGSWEIQVLQPWLMVMSPSDDPEELEVDLGDPELTFDEMGENLTLISDGIIMDQVVRFWEVGDGRGWHLNIVDDDNMEEEVDPADRVLAQRDYFKTRQQRPREGDGSVFLTSERNSMSNRNGEYIFQFIEYVEAAENDPSRGWFAPILYVLFFHSEEEEGPAPYGIFQIPFEFDVLVTADTGAAEIIGGRIATFGILPLRGEALGELDQEGGAEDTVERPAGWRFFDPTGITADAGVDDVFESHFWYGPEEQTFEISHIFSSANIISLVDLLGITRYVVGGPARVLPDGYEPPTVGYSEVAMNNINYIGEGGVVGSPVIFSDVVPLKDNLELKPEDLNRIPFNDFMSTAAFDETISVEDIEGNALAEAYKDDYVVTFSLDEQKRMRLPNPTQRLYYATMRIVNYSPLGEEDDDEEARDPGNVIFTWRFNPETDWIPYNAFKENSVEAPSKVPAAASGASAWSGAKQPVSTPGTGRAAGPPRD
jgi:hypothetical protein